MESLAKAEVAAVLDNVSGDEYDDARAKEI
jgi:hypothetical protein